MTGAAVVDVDVAAEEAPEWNIGSFCTLSEETRKAETIPNLPHSR